VSPEGFAASDEMAMLEEAVQIETLLVPITIPTPSPKRCHAAAPISGSSSSCSKRP
jgi:hypothetical protein